MNGVPGNVLYEQLFTICVSNSYGKTEQGQDFPLLPLRISIAEGIR